MKLALLLLFLPALAWAGPRALLDHALKTTKDARATFRQVRTDALGATTTDGTLEYARPRRLKLTWRGKAAATAWVDRDTVWFWQPGQGAVLRSRASAGGAPPALFLEESVAVLERTYRVTEEGATGLVLAPRAPGPWTRLTLALDPGTGWPRRLALTAADGTTTRLDFGGFRLNAGLPAARLRPAFPKGTSVVDL